MSKFIGTIQAASQHPSALAAIAALGASGQRRGRGGCATRTSSRRSARCRRFFKAFPEVGIAGAWAEFKSVQLNPDTALDGKTKELIGLAVASQIPCEYCVYFHTAAAKANGATDEEIRETVAMAAIVRHWSTVLNGMQVDLPTFKQEVDTVLAHAAEMAKAKVQ